ncbi:translation initiation factor IF-2-like [Peromyscus californicus insignis]|uniref:translation initiation factor IF-2-like n=1 Tax=Peromyscus californicus insignis TaxID=564181 RepID=UPI0022A7A6F3|nr:translation initiation factor IF-2-like [Peromyscus californicus insignis]
MVPRVSPARSLTNSPGFLGFRQKGGPPSGVPFSGPSDLQGSESPLQSSCCGSWGNDPGCFQRSAAHWLGSCERRGARERTASPPSSGGSPSTPRLEQEARACLPAGRKNPLPSFPAAAPRATWPAPVPVPVPAPAPPPPPQEAAGLVTLAEVTGREGNQAAGGGASPAPGPCPPPRPGRAGLDPRQPRRSGGGGEPPASPGGGPGPAGETSHPTGARRRRVRGSGGSAPLPELRWAGSPGRPRSPAAGNSRSSPSSGRSAQPRLPRLPRRRATCRPAGRPRGPPSPPPCPTRPGRPRSPARHPFPRPGGPAECVAAPAGGYFEREGERPGRGVFGFFLAPGPLAQALGCPRRRDTWKGRGGQPRSGSGLGRAPETPGPTCFALRAERRDY